MATEYGRKNGSYSTAVIGRWELIRQDIAGNYSVIRSHLYFYYGGGTSVGSSYSSFGTMGVTLKTGSYRYYPGETYLGYTDFTVYHNADGTFPETNIGFWAESYHISSGEVWGKISYRGVADIPRQANIKSAPDFKIEQNPTITYSNPAGNAVEELVASIYNTAGNVPYAGYRAVLKTGTSYTFNLTDSERKALSDACSGTSMQVNFYLRTKIGGKYYYSYVTKTMTISNAYVTSTMDFNDEQNPTIKYNNPSGFKINARLEFAGTTIRRDNISNTGSYTFNLTNDERNLLRSKCTGNSMVVREVIATCIIDSTEKYWSYQDKTMTIINGNPTFSNFTYQEVDAKTLALTGNNQYIIKGYSDVKVYISTANKAVANKQATMSKYRFSCGNSSVDIAYSSNSEVSGGIYNVPNGTFNVYAIDSRNNSKLVTKLAIKEIDYTPLGKVSLSVKRQNGVSERTIMQLEDTIHEVDFGAKKNTIKVCKYRYQIPNNNWSDYIDITPTVSNGTFIFNDLIDGDSNEGFNVSNSYNIEVYVEDALSSTTFTATLGSGTPNIAFHKNGVGIMGKYDTDVGGLVQLDRKNITLQVLCPFDDTPGSTWQEMMQRKLDFCIDKSTNNREVFFLNGGWQGITFGFGIFSNISSQGCYQLIWFSNDAIYFARKLLTGYEYKKLV